MVDKNSPFYVKSEFERRFYGNKSSTTFERSLKVEGRDKDHVKYTSILTQNEVM